MPAVWYQTKEATLVCESGYPSRPGQHAVSAITTSPTNAGANRRTTLDCSDVSPKSDQSPLDDEPLVGFSTTRSTYTREVPQVSILKAEAGGRTKCLRSPHSRARSEAVEIPKSRNVFRARAASSTEFSRCTPRRPFSSFISVATVAPAVLHTLDDGLELLGSFAPTSLSRRSLRSLLSAGSALPPPNAAARLQGHSAIDHVVTTYDPSIALPQESSSPPDSPTIPSICRTPSSYTGSDYFPTAPSSAGPPTPVREVSPSPNLKYKALHPMLESLEDTSKFRVLTFCATCKKVGTNLPCCPRCREMWCSRECRLRGSGGKRHVCRKRSG